VEPVGLVRPVRPVRLLLVTFEVGGLNGGAKWGRVSSEQ
jgi:hypothetical protein